MKNIFKWAQSNPEERSSDRSEEGSESPGAAREIPIPDIYNECTGDTERMPKLRNIMESSEGDGEGFDPYDTAVLAEE